MKKFRASVLIVMIGTILSKCLGLLREVLLASKYGTGYISDSFIISMNIPTVVVSALATAILTNYIPLYSKIEDQSEEEAKQFNGNLLSLNFIISTLLIILFFIFTKPILKLFASGFDSEGLSYLITLSRITIFSMYFIVFGHIFKGFLEFKGKFIGTSLYGIFMNLGIILGIFLSTSEKYAFLGYGVLLGYGLAFIALLLLALKNNFKYKTNVTVRDKNIKTMVLLTLPILLNDVVFQINGIVDKSISSTIGAGYISAINYSHYIVDVITSIFASSIVTVFFPNIIKSFNKGGIEVVKQKTNSIIKLIIFISIPFTVFISVYSSSIISCLFFRGAFNQDSLNITSTAVGIYSLAILFVSMKIIMFKVFYALQDTKSPTQSAIMAICLNIALSLILVRFISYKGIIIATIISSIFSTFLLLYKFKKKHGSLFTKMQYIDSIKVLIASLLSMGVLIFIKSLTADIFIKSVFISEAIKLVIGFGIGFVIYIVILYLMKYKIVKPRS